MIFSTLRRAARALVLVSLLGPGLAASLTPAPAAAQAAIVVREIVVIGNRRIEAATVASYLDFTVGDTVDAAALNRGVRRLFDTGLFSDASISVDGSQLIVRVEEAPTINRVAFEGNESIADEILAASVASRSRRAFTRSRAESDAQAVIELYRRAGRYGTNVEPVTIALPDNRVDLVFEIAESGVTGVNAISFVGNEAFSDRRLRRVIETSETGIFGFAISTDIYDPDRLAFDRELLRRFYLSRGHADFAVQSAVAELAPDREGFFITFTVEEGPVYAFGEQTVEVSAPGLEPEAFEALIEGAPGETYDADVIETNIDRMIFLAGQQGFAFVDVRPRAVRDPEGLTVGVVYEIAEGARVYVDRIDIEGNTRTLDRVIRRQFDLAEGDAFNSREIDRARRRIRSLGYFSEVDVATVRGASDDRANIRVSVQEQSTGSLTFGLGFSSADGVVGEVSVVERNFLGRGQFVRARVLAAGEQQVFDFTFREPAFLDRELELGLNLFFRQEDRTDESSFEETNFGFRPTAAFPVSEFGRLELNYTISSDEIRDVSADASPFIARDAGTQITSALGYRYIYDERNDPFQPTSGFVISAGQEVAGLGGDAQYIRTFGSARAFRSLFGEDLVGSLELEAGNITSFGDPVRITDRFFLGGDSFRGFENEGLGPRDAESANNDALGGENFVVLRGEVTFPLPFIPEEFGFAGGVFADVGTLFTLEDNTEAGRTVDDDAKLRASVGASIFWDSAFGPLRVNFAVPLAEEDGDQSEFFRLTAGTRF